VLINFTCFRTDKQGFFFFFLFKETPEAFPLPTEASIVKAAAGWAHCVAATGK
jgi:hypothetical protein